MGRLRATSLLPSFTPRDTTSRGVANVQRIPDVPQAGKEMVASAAGHRFGYFGQPDSFQLQFGPGSVSLSAHVISLAFAIDGRAGFMVYKAGPILG